MSTIRIEGHEYNTTKLDEKIKIYDFDEHTSVRSLLELINDQADSLISLEIKCSKLEEENKNLTFWKNQLEKQISPNWENTKRDCFQKSSTKKGS